MKENDILPVDARGFSDGDRKALPSSYRFSDGDEKPMGSDKIGQDEFMQFPPALAVEPGGASVANTSEVGSSRNGKNSELRVGVTPLQEVREEQENGVELENTLNEYLVAVPRGRKPSMGERLKEKKRQLVISVAVLLAPTVAVIGSLSSIPQAHFVVNNEVVTKVGFWENLAIIFKYLFG